MARNLSFPLPAADLAYWQSYAGKWMFCIYHEYRLQLSITRRGLTVRIKDTDCDESCELHLLRANAEQLVLRMFCENMTARLCIYPNAAGNSLIVEFTDHDHYSLCSPQEIASSHEYVCSPDNNPPDWTFGTWVEAGGDGFLRLRREGDDSFALSLWWDWGMKPPTKSKRAFYRILDINAADDKSIALVWQGANGLNRRMEGTILFDSTQQKILLRYTRREQAFRQATTG